LSAPRSSSRSLRCCSVRSMNIRALRNEQGPVAAWHDRQACHRGCRALPARRRGFARTARPMRSSGAADRLRQRCVPTARSRTARPIARGRLRPGPLAGMPRAARACAIAFHVATSYRTSEAIRRVTARYATARQQACRPQRWTLPPDQQAGPEITEIGMAVVKFEIHAHSRHRHDVGCGYRRRAGEDPSN